MSEKINIPLTQMLRLLSSLIPNKANGGRHSPDQDQQNPQHTSAHGREISHKPAENRNNHDKKQRKT